MMIPLLYSRSQASNGACYAAIGWEDIAWLPVILGYLCDVCGKDVEAIIDSDLYLRYIMGEVGPLHCPKQRERHIRCNPGDGPIHRRSRV